MRFMVIVKASKDSEAGVMPSQSPCRNGKYNEELVKAGVLVAAEGLHASKKGKRVRFREGTERDRRASPTKELIAISSCGQVRSVDHGSVPSREPDALALRTRHGAPRRPPARRLSPALRCTSPHFGKELLTRITPASESCWLDYHHESHCYVSS